MAENLHQEPARIAARARPALEGLLGALHPRLHPDDVFDLLRNAAIEIDREIDRALRRAVDPVEKRLQARPCRFRRAVDDEVGPEILAIFERPGLRALLDKEIERIVDRHVGDDVDLDPQLADEFGEDVAGEPVAVRILLMVHEMLGRRHFERMSNDPGSAVRRRAEAGDLGPKRNGAVVFVVRQVVDGGSNGHGWARVSWRTCEDFHNLLRCTIGPTMTAPVAALGSSAVRGQRPRLQRVARKAANIDVAVIGVPAKAVTTRHSSTSGLS